MEQDIKQVIQSDDTSFDEGLSVKSDDLKTYLPLKKKDFDDEKEYVRFVKVVERLVRSSPEYRDFITFTRETLHADVCSFTGEREDETGDVELHHYPLNLFDIVKAVIDEYIYDDKSFTSFEIAETVIQLHFQLKIGIVPLIGTLHKKYHKGNLQIPIEFAIGDYEWIKENYHLDPELVNKIETAKQITTHNTPELNWQPKYVQQIEHTDVSQEIKAKEVIKEKEVVPEKPKTVTESGIELNSSLDLSSILEDN